MAPKPAVMGPFVRGVNASTDAYTQPKGSVPRASSMIMTDRGALTPCDGSAIINWFNGAVQPSNGRFLSDCMFQPTGVNPYYLALAEAPGFSLGAPSNLTSADGGAGGTLAAGQYWYKVTALDGVGGETNVSVETNFTVLLNHKITLTWNTVPNAFGYNVYRSTVAGSEVLLFSTSLVFPLPAPQPSPLTATVTFTDDGTATTGSAAFTISTIEITARALGVTYAQVNLTSIGPASGGSLPCTIAGVSPGTFNGSAFVQVSPPSTLYTLFSGPWAALPIGTVGTGGTLTVSGSIPPPLSDTTQQTVLFKMPIGNIPVSYSDANIVAIFPASISSLGQVPTGGSGGSGTSGPGISGRGSSTPSGGVIGLVGPLPQMVQFTNRICIALGNGFPPQMYSDATGSPTNPATKANITSVTADANGVVTVVTTTPHGLTTSPSNAGANVLLENVTNPLFNGAFVVISITNTTTYKIFNPNTLSIASSGGTSTTTTIPIFNTFIPAYPTWAATSLYSVNSVIQPTVNTTNKSYFKAIQGGTTGGVEPTWASFDTLGQEVSDGQVIWQNQGALQTAAPAPTGAGHIYVYSGCLWVFNTSPKNTASGIDGPCSIRMSDVNNPFSWNPINQAFLDKDDGTEGMGLATFTISAEGIPPEGSLVAFKNYAGYQIVGIFGSSNFSIQRIRSDMGCTAPRSLWFVPGYGVARYAHLGVALFDGVRDTIVSEEMRPYLFPTNDVDNIDITVADANFMPFSQGCLTANPPMYVLAIPIGNSVGKLTRILNFDLVLKCWGGPIDLPFAISTMTQVRPTTSNPITIFGGFSDGVLQRWQAGDVQWYTGDPISITPVGWSMNSPEVFGNPPDQKLHWRRLAIRGVSTGISSKITVIPYVNGKPKPAQLYTVPVTGDFEVFAGMRIEGLRFGAVIIGSGHLEISRLDFHILPKNVGVPSVIS